MHVLGSVNTERGNNFVATGFDWKVHLTGQLYLRPGMCMAYTDGKTGLPPANVPGLSRPDGPGGSGSTTRASTSARACYSSRNRPWVYDVSDRFAIGASYTPLSNGQIFH